ncbi:hypothetical protein [Barnesiella intestinihominis]|uniref:hypothetical protein n=1 Tax=Barnesiella intestinihominis TaxID=487174 RepID=UPI002432A6B5|nr:hypothetical protein [Barnesiella intestinihominis]
MNKDYLNHVYLWLKANKPDYILVRFHFSDDPLGEYYWRLEPVYYSTDILWVGASNDFEGYIDEYSKNRKDADLKFFVFIEPGKKEEI